MRRSVALGLVGVIFLGVMAGNQLARGLAGLLERRLSQAFGAPARVGGVGLNLRGIEVRDIHIAADSRGVALALDRVTLGWNRLEIEGGDVVLEEERLFRGTSLDAEPEVKNPAVSSPGRFLLAAKSVRFESLSVSLSSSGGTRELGTFRGEIVRQNEGLNGHVFATMGASTLETEGQFAAARESAGGLRFQGALDVRALGVAWEGVSVRPVDADARVELHGRWDGTTLSVSEGRVQSGRVELEWSGSLGFAAGAPVADVKLLLPRTDCQDLIDAIPSAVMAEFSGFVLDGTMEGELRLRLAPERPDRTLLQTSIRDRCRFRDAPSIARLARFQKPFVHRVPDGLDGEGTLTFETGPSTPDWVPLSEVSPFFVHAVLAQEDAQFFAHEGFLNDAFEAALARNLKEGRFAAGGSTISMQLARNLFLVREKTLSRKVQELVLTWWLEKSLSKPEILELYVNLVEFGPRVYGIGPASRHYFERAPESLSPAEAAFLATVLPSPAKRHRDYERGGLSSWGRARVEQLLRRMWERGRIDQEALSHGLTEAGWLSFHQGSERPQHFEDFGWAAPLPFS